jgi:hypothetical protein
MPLFLPAGHLRISGAIALAADGAPPGANTVTVFWTPKSGAGGDEGADAPFFRYLSPESSPLHVEVKNQPTVLEPFQLTLK